ncbi:hypothetical protein [Solemya velum gill symbiont]|uniref:hypothetical protein n=1 Tax=Solemya velum gill symbiont TaxID=2340 RepID=UPI0015C2DC35|nr:hypothetical protein [Solemya velum gill symbiont]
MESNVPSLSLQRTKLSLDYATKMTAYPSNPAYDCVFHAQHKNLYEQYQRFIPSFRVRTIPHFEAAEIPSTDILPNKLSNKPPWSLKIPTIRYTMYNESKSTTHLLTFQSLFAEIRHTYSTHQPVNTDQRKVSAVMYAPPFVDTAHLPNNSSIFSAELYALLFTLRYLLSKVIILFFINQTIIYALAVHPMWVPGFRRIDRLLTLTGHTS